MVVMVSQLDEVLEHEIPPSGELDPVPGAPASWALMCLALDGRVSSVSGTTLDLLGWEPDELVGTRLMQSIDPDDRNTVSSLAAIVVSMPGVARALSHRMIRRDGVEVWVESTTTSTPSTRSSRPCSPTSRCDGLGGGSADQPRAGPRPRRGVRLLAEEIPSGAFRVAVGRIRFANSHFRRLAGA